MSKTKNIPKVDYSVKIGDILKEKKQKRQKNLQSTIKRNTLICKEFKLETVKRSKFRKIFGVPEVPIEEPKKKDFKEILYKNKNQEVKWTRAMILKEEEREKKSLKEKKNELIKMESNLRDSLEFKEWQLKMIELDDQIKREDIERTKKQNLQAKNNMKKALRKELKEKREKYFEIKKEQEFEQQKIKSFQNKELKRKKKLKKIIEDSHQNMEKVNKEIRKKNKAKVLEKKEIMEINFELKKIHERKELE